MSAIMLALPEFAFGRADKRSHAHLLETVAHMPLDIQDKLRSTVSEDRMDGGVGSRERADKSVDMVDMEIDDENTDVGGFMKAPSQETIEACIANFIDATYGEFKRSATCLYGLC